MKRSNPISIEHLKEFIQEEWCSISSNLIENFCIGYLDRIKKVIELKGERLEHEHLKQKSKDEFYIWERPKELPLTKILYNDQQQIDLKDLIPKLTNDSTIDKIEKMENQKK